MIKKIEVRSGKGKHIETIKRKVFYVRGGGSNIIPFVKYRGANYRILWDKNQGYIKW